MSGQENLDFLQFGDASKRSAQHFPGQQVIIAFQQGFEGFVEVAAADGARDGRLNGRIEPDFDADAGKLVQNLGKRRFAGLEPQSVAFQAEKQGPSGPGGQKNGQKGQKTEFQEVFSHKTAW